MALPLDIRDLVTSGATLRTEREKPLRIAVFIDAEAPEQAVEALRAVLRPQMSTARLHVEPVVPGDVLVVDEAADLVVAITGPNATLAPSLAQTRERFLPTALLALNEDKTDVARRLEHPTLDTLVGDDTEELMKSLGRWMADRIGTKRLALAANFEFVRRAVAEEAIKNTAFQNAVVGGVMIIPGADMPIMTANQGKMILQVAAAYGEPLGAERVKELAAVVGGAFALRTVARQVLTLIPGFGWAIKAAVGYSGTLAMGYAAIEYFEGGGDVKGLAEKVRQARDRAMDTARRRRRLEEPPIPAHAWPVETEDTELVAPAVLPPADDAVSLADDAGDR